VALRRADHLVHGDHPIEMRIDRHVGDGLQRVNGDLGDRLEDENTRFHGLILVCTRKAVQFVQIDEGHPGGALGAIVLGVGRAALNDDVAGAQQRLVAL